jgi:hypothetical protein
MSVMWRVANRSETMYVDKPVIKETLWEWRAFGDNVDPNIRRNIQSLPIKDGKSIRMLDRYLCRAGCYINIKIREEDLKVKNFHKKTHAGIEQWTTETYGFPITAAMFRSITKALKIEIPGRAIKDGKQLVSVMSEASPSVQVISVQKRRELHVSPAGDIDGAIIELAKISKPEKIITISVEHRNLEKVSKALEDLQLPSPSMKVLNYVDSLKVWTEGKKLF